MINNTFAKDFIEEHIRFWNSHHLKDILSHYSDEIVLISPLAVKLVENCAVKGKKALGEYFQKGLEAYPDLQFELRHCY